MPHPLSGSAWSHAGIVASFSRSAPNAVLIDFAAAERPRHRTPRAIDIGCGAARNTLPLAQQGWTLLGIDLSQPMLVAAATRIAEARLPRRVQLALAPMHAIPARDASADLVIAHGIWNLARSEDEFRRAVQEAARVATRGAAVFVFTFARATLPADATPLDGTSFVFTQFSGQPQCFLTEEQLVHELGAAGLTRDPAIPLRELNRRPPGTITSGAPVIYEGVFRATA
jgi:SAM-dependent methyltransferase